MAGGTGALLGGDNGDVGEGGRCKQRQGREVGMVCGEWSGGQVDCYIELHDPCMQAEERTYCGATRAARGGGGTVFHQSGPHESRWGARSEKGEGSPSGVAWQLTERKGVTGHASLEEVYLLAICVCAVGALKVTALQPSTAGGVTRYWTQRRVANLQMAVRPAAIAYTAYGDKLVPAAAPGKMVVLY